MMVIVNGESHEVAATTLGQLLKELDFQGDWLATAVNAELVHREEREHFTLKPEDRIEILSPRQGG